MLNVQQFLKNGTIEELTNDFGIICQYHDELPLVILNYNQLDSPKTHPIVRECRGLVLHSQSYDIVAKSFNRFYNWGEVREEMDDFDFSDFIVQSKEDGSLAIIYHFDGKWHMNTRGSFGCSDMQFQSFTWREGMLKALGVSCLEELDKFLNPQWTYICEFVSPWNKVVRRYDEPKMYLLSIFDADSEIHHQKVDEHFVDLKELFTRPDTFEFHSIEEIQKFLQGMSASDPTFEGVVIRDSAGNRWKIKSPTYLGLHRLGSCKESLFNPKNLLPFIWSGEKDELLTYFPEVREHYENLEQQVFALYEQLERIWLDTKDIVDQKEFALAILGKTPLCGILFSMRKNGEEDLKAIWQDSQELILKILKK